MDFLILLFQPLLFVIFVAALFFLVSRIFRGGSREEETRRGRNGEIYTEAREVKRPENEEVQDLDKNMRE